MSLPQACKPRHLRWQPALLASPDVVIRELAQRRDSADAAYAAPFPDARYKAGVRRFPELVMTDPGMPGIAEAKRALQFWRDEWSGPTFMAVGRTDPVLGPEVIARLRTQISGCPAPLEVPDGGHFVQEKGDRIARAALIAFGSG